MRQAIQGGPGGVRILQTVPVTGTAAEMAADAAAIIAAESEVASQGKRWENTTDGLVYDFRQVGGIWDYYPETNADVSGKIPVTGLTSSPTSVTTDLTMSATGDAQLLADGVRLGQGSVRLSNLGATTEVVRYTFGVSELDAKNNLTIVTGAATTGERLQPIADVPSLSTIELKVPVTALAIAVGPAVAGDVNTVELAQRS